ncbi:NAD(P)-dependent oxidoreductase [Neolewinella antarctica]|uniref:Glycerate dehydrogenase n=1 Tax=Neolewinella antarctica TaxID=442734 RepID=A0ABX0X792_9BACT|nr:NAD(P)-dependent oxidoreductase [Neolewinella antarctica]NJC24883.1 glycerate dehydrogenase [Neolewinella antarctica]
MNIVFLDSATLTDLPAQLDRLRELGQCTFHESTEPGDAVARLAGAQVAISNKVYLGEPELTQLPDLRLICIAATGKNNVDLPAAERRNVAVRNVSGYSTESVAQLTLTALFSVAMDITYLNEACYDGTYAASAKFSYWRRPFFELRGKRHGIIGLGTIGRRVAELVEAFGGEVVYYSTSGRNVAQRYESLPLAELLRTCDSVSIHCPLNAATENLLGTKELAYMKPSAYLVNVARGGIVNEVALVRAINENVIAGAAVDVFTAEPLPADHPYHGVKDRNRLLLTPHIGWASVEARTALVDGIVDNIQEGW